MIMAKDSNNNYVKIEDIKQQNSFNEISPIEFKGSGENLENYRIYGQTENGESVGDRTGNLFNGDLQKGYWINATDLGQTSSKAFRSFKIFLPAGTYTLSFEINVNIVRLIADGTLTINVGNNLAEYTVTTQTDGDIGFSFRLAGTTQVPWDNSDIMLNVGSTALPYEPYGYKVPVTVEGKNLLPNTATSQTVNGVTFTVNNDGSVTCNGTARGFAVVYLGGRRSTVVHPTGNEYSLSKGTYKLTGCPINGTGNTFYQEVYSSSINLTRDYGDGTEFNVTTNDIISVRLVIFSGYTCNNLIFYPMIRKADIEDDTYEPYHAPVTTNIYLPKQIKMVGNEAEYIDYGEQKQCRVRKNLLRNTAESQIQSGVTFTVNDDGGVTCNGTSTSRYFSLFRIPCYLVAGEYIISGCPVGGDSDTYRADIRISPNGTMIGSYMDIGVGATIVIDESGWYDYTIRIQGGYTVDNITFKPMIRKAGIEDDTYEPFIENTELDVTLPALPTLFGTNILSVNTNTKPSKVWGKLSDPKDILYVKDSSGNTLFSKYHETNINGSPPLTYEAKKWGNLSNYLIYGNTIEGESVGDKTDNIIRDYAVVRTQAQYAVVLSIDTELIPNTTYSFTCLLNSSELRLYINENLFNTISYVKDDVVLKVIVETLSELPDSQKINGKWIMLKNSITEPVVPELSNIMMIKGSEMPAIYEPYGYRVPVTVSNGTDTKTTNLYLPAQIKMVGDEVEFINFGAQKHYRVRKNLLNYSSIEIGRFDFSTGEKVPDSSQFRTSTPIKVKPNESYAISGVASGQVRVFLYNGNMNMISTVLCSDNSVVETTGSTFFVNVAGIKSAWSEQIQLEIGSEATGYEPYIEDTELNVTLPALPTISGTNTLTVGTEVQPSQVDIKGKIKGKIYGWHVNPDISDSSNAVTYLKDAIGMTPASMGSTTFDYGSWENAFFMPKPCMLKSNGKVDYYLDPNDYTKKLNGTASDISNPNYDGNAMMQWPKIWFKYVKGVKEGQGYFYVANYKADGNFHCWCNYDSEDNEIDHFYTAIYNGTSFANYSSSKTYVINDFAIYDNKLYKCNTDIATAESFDNTKWDLVSNTAPVINKMRSLSGVRLTNNNGNAQTNTTTEVTRATANNTTSAAEWYIETFSDRLLINGLLVLMGKSLNTQAVFGRGLDTGGQSAKEAYVTGTLNDKGLFWGVTENGNSGVKVFGMENFWGCCWHRTAGLITNNYAVKLKLTYGTKDGSAVIGYNQTGNGYIDNGTAPYSNGYVQKMSYNKYGFIPAVVTGGSQSTYYADYHYQNANYTGTIYALFGGVSGFGLRTGAFFLNLCAAPGASDWGSAASLSCKPLLN